jgi:ribonucleoside-diphosphate reductase beta chain
MTNFNDEFKKEIYKMVRTIVNIEHSFIDFAFKGFSPEGLDKRDVKTYIEYIADRRLIQLGLKENYGIEENPLTWFDELTNGSSLQNFFEGRSADYDVAGLTGEWRY